MAVVCVFTSCLSSSDDTQYTDDVALTSFTLGTVKCYRHTTASNGSDSIYSYSYSASNVSFRIDQVNRRVFNEDSLVAGSDVSRVLASIYALNDGYVMIKNLTDDRFSYYSASDSIDFSKPRTIAIVSGDGAHRSEYTVEVNVHKEYADSFTWQKKAACPYALAYKKVKATMLDGTLFVLGMDDSNVCQLVKSSDAATWTECNKPVGVLPENTTVATVDNTLFLYDGTTLFSSTDGMAWSTVAMPASLASVVGGTKEEMYGIAGDGSLMVSKDMGVTWAQDAVEDKTYNDNTDKLPASDVSIVAMTTPTNKEIARMTIVANKKYEGVTDKYAYAVVWNKVVDAADPQTWTFNSVTWNNHYNVLPRMENLSAAAYADGIIAIGGAPINNSAKAYTKIYYSPDYGTTWHEEKGFRLPAGFAKTDAAAIVADGKGFFYVVSAKTGEVWKGRQNKRTWTKVQKEYK